MLPTLIMQTLTVWLTLLGIASFGIGVLIALLASRAAPDGFEDQAGFHVGRKTDSLVEGLRTNGWLSEEEVNCSHVTSTKPAAR